MIKITEEMKLRAFAKAPAGWYVNICPGCGEVIYTLGRNDGKQTIHEPCKTAFEPIDMGELMYGLGMDDVDMDDIREGIRTAQSEAEDDMTGKTVTVSVCPICKGFEWSFDGGTVTCAGCKPDHMIIDTFVL